MKLATATVTFHGDLTNKLRAIAAAGFTGVEVFATDIEPGGMDAAAIGELVADLGLSVSTFMPFREFEAMPEPARSDNFDRAERQFDIMQALGTDLLLTCTNVSPDASPEPKRAIADFHELGERAAARGFRVGVEPLAWARHVSDYRDGWDIIQRVDHPNVGLVLDSFHVLALGLPVEPIGHIPSDRIFDIQITDAPWLDMDLMPWSRQHRCLPGRGDFDLVSFVRAIKATGYTGVYSLEIFATEADTVPLPQHAVDALQSLQALMDTA